MATAVGHEFISLQGRGLRDSKKINPVVELLRIGYDKYWLGDPSFYHQTLPNTSEILYLRRGNRVDAVTVHNGNRITMLVGRRSDAEIQEDYHPGRLILEKAVQVHPQAWATVSVKNEPGPRAMRGLFDRSGFRRVGGLAEVADLYQSLGNTPHGDQFWSLETVSGMTFAHTMSIHDQSNEPYWQFAFARPRS